MQRKSGKFVCQCPLGLKLLRGNGHKNKKSRRFQCPLGLIPHFYCKSNYGHDQAYAGFNALSGLYLISTFNPYYFENDATEKCFNALSGLYLISTQLYFASKLIPNLVSMPSRAYTSFLRGYMMKSATLKESVSMPSRAYTSFLQLKSSC